MFYWPYMKALVRKFMEEYDVRKQAIKERVLHPRLLQPLPLSKGIWKNMTTDLVEGLPKSGKEHNIGYCG